MRTDPYQCVPIGTRAGLTENGVAAAFDDAALAGPAVPPLRSALAGQGGGGQRPAPNLSSAAAAPPLARVQQPWAALSTPAMQACAQWEGS